MMNNLNQTTQNKTKSILTNSTQGQLLGHHSQSIHYSTLNNQSRKVIGVGDFGKPQMGSHNHSSISGMQSHQYMGGGARYQHSDYSTSSQQHHGLNQFVNAFQPSSHFLDMPKQAQSHLRQMSQDAFTQRQSQRQQGSCIFIGNIPYDSTDRDMLDTLRMVGPFELFRLKLDKETNQPKGFGFVEYRDQDLASSALRNLNKHDLNKRELKVDFASDNKNGVNLKGDDIRFRDSGEIITGVAEGHRVLTGSSRQDYSTDDIVRNFSSKQEEMLLYAIRLALDRAESKDLRDTSRGLLNSTLEGPEVGKLVELLAHNPQLLDRLMEMVDKQLNMSHP